MGFRISFYTNRKHQRAQLCLLQAPLPPKERSLAAGAVSPWWPLSGRGAGNTLRLAFLRSICLAKHPCCRAEQQLLFFAARYSIVWKHYKSFCC